MKTLLSTRFKDCSYTEILEGFSSERKFRIHSQPEVLLRVSNRNRLERIQYEFDMMKQFQKTGVPMSEAIEYGSFENYAYLITSWVVGETIKIPSYELGYEAGRIQKQLEQIQVESASDASYNKYMDKFEEYKASLNRIPNDECIVEFIDNTITALKGRPLVQVHGDYHIANLVQTGENSLAVIDFNRLRISDPYESFYKVQMFEPRDFACGHLDGYFNSEIPDSFWLIHAVYVAIGTLASITWAERTQEIEQVRYMQELAQQAAREYTNYQSIIPNWYMKKKQTA